MSFEERIQSNIAKYGYHVTIVMGDVHPRFAYSIGLKELFGFELVFAGGAYYSNNDVFQIFGAIVSKLKIDRSVLHQKIITESLGEFTLSPVDDSWSRLMLLGVFDYYHNEGEIPVYQIIPDVKHFTNDIPDMSKQWCETTEPVWRWLDGKCDDRRLQNAIVITNLDALQGNPITEMMRWEPDEWEMFANPATKMQEKDMRVVPLAIMLGIDNTLLPAVDLKIGKGLWRENREGEWAELGINIDG